MKNIILTLSVLMLLSACTKTILIPEPVTYHPPSILMQPPHTNITISKTAVTVDGTNDKKVP